LSHASLLPLSPILIFRRRLRPASQPADFLHSFRRLCRRSSPASRPLSSAAAIEFLSHDDIVFSDITTADVSFSARGRRFSRYRILLMIRRRYANGFRLATPLSTAATPQASFIVIFSFTLSP
jgi:hypothetical protein